MPPIKLVNPKTGEELTASDEKQASLIRTLGYRDVTGEEAAAATSAEAEKDYYSGGWQQAVTAVEGGLRGATFGLLDDGSTESELRRTYNPKTALISELGGAIAPAVLSGGESLIGAAARSTPMGALSRGATLASEALAEGKVARGAISGLIEGGGQVAGTALVDALHNKPETAEHLTANLGLGLVFGGGLGALGGAIGGKLEAAGDKATAKLAAKAEEEAVLSSRRLADDFLERGDVQVRLKKVDGAVEAAKQDLAQAQARAEKQLVNETELTDYVNQERLNLHNERQVASFEDTIDKAAVPYHRELKQFGDSLFDDLGLNPSIAKEARAEVSSVRKAYQEALDTIETAKGPSVQKPRAGGSGSYDEISTKLEDYRGSLSRLAKKLGREDEVPGKLEDVAKTYQDHGAYYTKGESTVEPPTPIKPDASHYKRVEEIKATQETLANFKTVKLSKASPEEFLANAKQMGSLLESGYVSKATKEALTDALDDVAKNGFGFGTNAAALKGLDVGEMAKALGLSDDVAFAAASVPEIAKPYAAGWVAFQSLEQTPAKLKKLVQEAKEGRGLLSRLVMGAAAGKAATVATAATGSRAAGYAVFHTVVQGGLHAIEGASHAIQQKIVQALARWGGPVGSAIRKTVPTTAGRLTASELHPLPHTAKETYAKHYKEVLQQWKDAASPAGADRLYSNLAPVRDVSPGLANQMAVQAQKVAAQVVAKAPQDPGNVYFGMKSSWQPDELELHKWLDYAEVALMGPQKAVELFSEGKLSEEGAAGLRDHWPQTFMTVRSLAAAKLATLEDQLSYNDYIKVSNLLGLPATGTMNPDFIKAQQEMFFEQAAETMSNQAHSVVPSPSPQTKNQQISQR